MFPAIEAKSGPAKKLRKIDLKFISIFIVLICPNAMLQYAQGYPNVL
jgi:hypothetical protein